MLTWRDDQVFVIGETTFRVLSDDAFAQEEGRGLTEEEILVFKPRALVERQAALIEELKPQRIMELGFYVGGSTLFIAELSRPNKLVAVDRNARTRAVERTRSHAAARGHGDVVRFHGGVDQADRQRLAEIVDEEFEGAALDLVIDDCSHLYEPTRASFNELFPRLRAGGAYVIEDWRWAQVVGPEGSQGQLPLTHLLFEIILALAGLPGVIADVSIEEGLALIRRGETAVDPSAFDVSASSNPRGRDLLRDLAQLSTGGAFGRRT